MEGILLGTQDNLYDKLYVELLKKRIIFINQAIDDSIIDMVTMPIILKNIEESDIAEDKLQPLTIYLNTDGGDVVVANHLIEVIQKSRIPIHVRVLAKACSAGLLITLACKHRIASKESVFLLHDGSCLVSGSSGKARDTMDFFDDLDGKIKELVITRTKIDETEYKKLERKEIYCFGQEALEKYGFIDELV
jgi:ATP-dependent Clp protease protease subunit